MQFKSKGGSYFAYLREKFYQLYDDDDKNLWNFSRANETFHNINPKIHKYFYFLENIILKVEI